MEEILKPEDLMVNDIVLAEAIVEDENGDECIDWHPFRVTDVSPSGEVYNDNGDNCKYIGNWMDDCEAEILGDLEPMPLTPEILEANGFVIDEDNKNLTAYLYGKKDANGYKIPPYAHVVYGKYPNDFHFDVVGEYRQVKGNRFHYVHELQHALRLCELKNLANNFKLKKQ